MSATPERRQKVTGAAAYSDIQVDLTRMIFHKIIPAVVLSSVGIVSTTVILAGHYRDSWLWMLSWVMLVVCIFRLSTAVAYQLSPTRETMTDAAALKWQLVYGLGTFLTCATMATSCIYNFHVHDYIAERVCTFGVFMYCAGLSARLGMRPWINQLCGIIMLFALAYAVLHSHQPLSRVSVGIIAFFAFAHCSSVQTKFDIVVDQLRTKRKLRDLAEHDGLTGLANRRYFQERLASGELQMTTIALLYIDLDRFKKVNDTHGHRIGDTLLQQVADRLRSAIRDSDLLARIGGDEFAILHSPMASEESAQSLARRINVAIAAPFHIEGEAISIGASVGIRLAEPGCQDTQRALSLADSALYRVKQAGGGSFCVSES